MHSTFVIALTLAWASATYAAPHGPAASTSLAAGRPVATVASAASAAVSAPASPSVTTPPAPSAAGAAPPPATARRPLWELGMGGGSVLAPDYPGSDHYGFWFIPFPFGVYRGEILHSDRRGGTRARLLRGASFEFNVSAGGGLPSSSANNRAREGMPDLEWVGEIGPRLMFDLWSDGSVGGQLLRFGLPVRAALSTNFQHLTDRGFVLAPELMYEHPHLFGSRVDGNLKLTVSLLDRRFNSYFYNVAPEFATRERPAYAARAGYLQSELSAGLVVPLPQSRLKIFTFGSVQYLDGSANQTSPLFRTPVNASLSVVLLWLFSESRDLVESED